MSDQLANEIIEFGSIDTELKAYMYGLFNSPQVTISGGRAILYLPISFYGKLDKLGSLVTIIDKESLFVFTNLPNLLYRTVSDALLCHLARGIFELSYNFINDTDDIQECCIITKPDVIQLILNHTKIPATVDSDGTRAIFRDENALDFMFFIYSGSTIYDQRLKNIYTKWSYRIKYINYGLNNNNDHPTCYFAKAVPEAITPTKCRASDVGYDLTLIGVFKEKAYNTTLYDTGIIVKPPNGWYIQIVPRSSFSGNGYIIANHIGIIDRSYRGRLLVALTKIDSTAPDIKFPCKWFQIIFVPAINFDVVEVSKDGINETHRGDKGFGSSDLK